MRGKVQDEGEVKEDEGTVRQDEGTVRQDEGSPRDKRRTLGGFGFRLSADKKRGMWKEGGKITPSYGGEIKEV